MNTERFSPIEMTKDEFKAVGHKLVDQIAGFIEHIDQKSVTASESPKQIQNILRQRNFPDTGTAPAALMDQAVDLLFNHSLFNGHPKFLGYITSSAAPIGALADLLAATINPNMGAHILSPMATEIERQTVQWLGQFIGMEEGFSGLLVSGGNMANLNAFLAARTAKAPLGLKEQGLASLPKMMTLYCSKTTHTWIDKAATLFGHGSNAIRWIDTLDDNTMDTNALDLAIQKDIKDGHQPFLVVGTAGDVSTGVVDDLATISKICKKHDLWFHVDGAYGVPAAILPEYQKTFEGIKEADSIAMDPHKWLYAPMEAGCTLVKNPQHLINTYSSHPEYYNFKKDNDDQILNYLEYGMQNSRGFRALKVWLALQQVGKEGYIQMIDEDIKLAQLFYDMAEAHPELEAVSCNLSITTLRYIPLGILKGDSKTENYLNELNEKLLNSLQAGGELFLSNAVVKGKYCLRGCIVNFRTDAQDIEEMIEIIVREGKKISDTEL